MRTNLVTFLVAFGVIIQYAVATVGFAFLKVASARDVEFLHSGLD